MSSNLPAVIEPKSIAIAEMKSMADAIAGSGLFGIKTPQQALALMLLAQAEGLHPAVAARDYDIIQGRPAKKSEAMLRSFIATGGTIQWHELTDAKAEATFSHPAGGTIKLDWTIERATRAELTQKKNSYGSPNMWQKYPRQMLRARLVSEGVRTICPSATGGLYVPEEMDEVVVSSKPRTGHGFHYADAEIVQTETKTETKTDTPPPHTPPPVTETRPGVFEPKPELVAAKWFTRIEQSPTIPMLKEIGELLKSAPLAEADMKTARALYKARLKQLTDIAQEPLPMAAGNEESII